MEGNATDETYSYSEEEVENRDQDMENDIAASNIERIVAEHEILEEQQEQALKSDDDKVDFINHNESDSETMRNANTKKSNSKGKKPKRPKPTEDDVMTMFKFLHSEIERLKQEKSDDDESSDEDHGDFKNRIMASTRSMGQKPCSSGISLKKLKTHSNKESSDKNEQFSSANKKQLSSENVKQLSPAK